MASRRERLRRRSSTRSPAGAIALRVAFVSLLAAVVLLVAGAATAFAVVSSWLQKPKLPEMSADAFYMPQATHIYSGDRKPVLLATFSNQNRVVINLDQMSPWLVKGIVAVEDERFYQHQGVDFVGVLRAAILDLMGGHVQQGASTITQQYVRNTVLVKEKNERSLQRKVREMYLASELEAKFGKEKILSGYLNTVYFGEGAYGVEAAAETYFGKHASELTLAQAAMIAGLPQSPIRLSPFHNLKGAIARRNVVLDRMVANHYITVAQELKAESKRVVVNTKRVGTSMVYSAPYFVEYVHKILIRVMGSKTAVDEGGLQVYTTLDTGMQRTAEQSVAKILDRKGDPAAALVAIDPRTGAIRAMVGGDGSSQFNYAAQAKRQPGSSFKVFVLAEALTKDIPPNRGIDSASPVTIPSKPKPWVVSNSEGKGSGYMSIESATWHSVNCVYARLIQELGPANVRDLANRMGITTKLPKIPSIALGTAEVTPLEMASAYSTLADNGVHNQATSILKITRSDGTPRNVWHPHGTKVLTPEVAYAETKILEGVISQGTGTAADIGRPAAGKTGTTQNYGDAWFVGYTPQLATSVWVGYPDSQKSMSSVHGIRVFGGTFPAQIWSSFMRSALPAQTEDFKSEPAPSYIWDPSWHHPTPPPAPKPVRTGGSGTSGGSGGSGKSGGRGKSGGSGGSGKGGGSGNGGGGSGNTSGTP